MKFFVVLLFLIALGMAQLDRNRCSFSCTRQASFDIMIDRQQTKAQCSSGNNVEQRCSGCCLSWGLSNRISQDDVAGFPSSDQSCSISF